MLENCSIGADREGANYVAIFSNRLGDKHEIDGSDSPTSALISAKRVVTDGPAKVCEERERSPVV